MLNVGLYLESQSPTEVSDGGILNCFSFGGNSQTITKKEALRIIRDIFESDGFKTAFGEGKGLNGQELLEWQVGIHSVQKNTEKHVRYNGSIRDFIDICGR